MPYKDKEKQKEYQREWIARRRASWLEDKSCASCGSTDKLEIDHIDPAYKWKHNFWSYSWVKIYAELEKCQVLCSGCHRDKTDEYLGAYEPAEHGTHRAYNKKKCRCAVCIKFHNDYISEWRKSN